MKKILILLIAITMLVSVTSVASARTTQREPATAEIIFDIMFLKPVGASMTVIGTGIYVIGLPWTTITRSSRIAAEKLILDPFNYTFVRPVGEQL